MPQPNFKRILLKLSGEALMGEQEAPRLLLGDWQCVHG